MLIKAIILISLVNNILVFGKADKFVQTIGSAELIIHGEIIGFEKNIIKLKNKEIIKGNINTEIITIDNERTCKDCNRYNKNTETIFFLFRKEGDHYYMNDGGNSVIFIKKDYCYSPLFRRQSLSDVKEAIKGFGCCFEVNKDRSVDNDMIIICSEKDIDEYKSNSSFHEFIVRTIMADRD